MTDTAQALAPAETDPNVQLDEAATAFKAFDNPASVQPRAPDGKWTKPEEEQPEETAETEDEAELEAEEAESEEETVEADEEDEAAEEAQPMPPSWGAEDEELWTQLPPEAQARIASREGERDRGLNLKLQETANARKAYETRAKEVSTRLEDLEKAVETVEAIYSSPEPDPRAFGYGTQQFNEAAFRAAHQEWQQNSQAIAQLTEQRDAARKEKAEAEKTAFAEWKQEHEAQYAPKLLADVPELKDPAKADATARELVTYAIANGIPEDVFAEEMQDQITSAQLHLIWKAMQFDKVKAAKPAAKPKKTPGPAVRPGVSSPRSAQKAVRRQKDFDRLDREGTVEAAAAYFKNL